jgi:endonuclease/exonuclease/phosphatase family metal-dependent hydrolase
MGDFNMIPGQDVSNFHHLGGDDVMDFASSWDLQDRYSHILKSGRQPSGRVRRVAAGFPPATSRAVCGCFQCTGRWAWAARSSASEVSDHLPFTASFRMF